MSSWHTYGSIYNLGHRAVRDLLTVPHFVQEKVDGSQFSFGKFETPNLRDFTGGGGPPDFELRIRSKGAVMNIDAPEKMFNKAAKTVKALAPLLHVGWTYRGEYLAKPKHNVLAYDRAPEKHIILFDIATEEETYLSPHDLIVEGNRIGLEVVPTLWAHATITYEDIQRLLDNTTSVLGGQKIEGVVIKQYPSSETPLFGPDKKLLMGKFVSEAFKEVHGKEWRSLNPTKLDVVDDIIQKLRTPARWNKAVQHLRERGLLTDSPRDIGMLIKEVQADTLREEAENIKDALFRWAEPRISRAIIAGLPEHYKELLLKAQFEKETTDA